MFVVVAVSKCNHANNEQQYVAYLRVSTQKQGYSGLGLEAQREIIKNFLHAKTTIAEYVKVESDRHNDCPKLKEALTLCKTTGATLKVAKLDRLARNYDCSNGKYGTSSSF